MTLPGRHVAALAIAAALTLTPALRVACLAWCAAPTATTHGTPVAADAAAPAVAAERHHAHHHANAAATTLDPTSPTATASASAADSVTTLAATPRCDSDRGRPCADPLALAPLPGARSAAVDAMPALLPASPTDPRPSGRVAFASSPSRVPPPGPPPASLPLRI